MGFRDLSQQEIEAALSAERVVRLAFTSEDEVFVVPVFFAWHEGSLWGFTVPGRKTRMAGANPRVGFQVDSSATTGVFAWASVSGQGTFSVVANEAEIAAFTPKFQSKMTDAPPWALTMLLERFAKYGRVPFRITPTVMSGRVHEE